MSISQLPSDVVNNILLPYLCKNSETEAINQWMSDVADYCKDKPLNTKFLDLPEFVPAITVYDGSMSFFERSFSFYVVFVAKTDVPFTVYDRLKRTSPDYNLVSLYTKDMRYRFVVEEYRKTRVDHRN